MMKRKRPRAYMLIEAMISGCIAAVALAAIAAQLGNAQHAAAVASRQVTATMLANTRIEQARSLKYAGLASPFWTSPEALNVGGGPYTRTTTVSSGSDAFGSFRSVTVTVTFLAESVQVVTHVYDL